MYHLDLKNTRVLNLEPLSRLTQLGSLSLDNTQISDITPLAKLIHLDELGLAHTQVSEAQIDDVVFCAFGFAMIDPPKLVHK